MVDGEGEEGEEEKEYIHEGDPVPEHAEFERGDYYNHFLTCNDAKFVPGSDPYK